MLDALFATESLLDAARQATGTESLDLQPFEGAFDRLVTALGAEAGLYPARAWRTLDSLLEELTIRVDRRHFVALHPEIESVRIERPVVITGLPRTGTTLLHGLLASLPGFRAFPLWELRQPIPRGKVDRREETRKQVAALYDRVPVFRSIHPLAADAPDECSWLFRHAFSSLAIAFHYHVPSYRRWVSEVPQSAAYRDYRRWLEVLRLQHPEGRLVLKDPCHLWHLGPLLDTFPDASVFVLHRAPEESVPSLASLCHTLQSMDSSCSDPQLTGRYVLEMVEAGVASAREARAQRPRALIFDIEYRRLVERPLETLEDVLSRLGLTFDESTARAASTWLTEHRQHAAGRHAYSCAEFGMSASDLSRRFATL